MKTMFFFLVGILLVGLVLLAIMILGLKKLLSSIGRPISDDWETQILSPSGYASDIYFK